MRPNYDKLRSEGVDVPYGASGRKKYICPKCHDRRKNKRDKALYVNFDHCIAMCFYCGWKLFFGEDDDWKSRHYHEPRRWKPGSLPHQTLKKEIYMTKNDQGAMAPNTLDGSVLSQRVITYFKNRGIEEETLREAGVFSTQEFMPQTGKKENVIAYPYLLNGEVVNIKYRSARKHFKLIKDARLVPFGIDTLEGAKVAVITEGEPDALSVRQVMKLPTISVPNGATTNLTYLDSPEVTEKLDSVERFYIAVDTDKQGLTLRGELIRRLGEDRCLIVTYGEDCKDANELLVAEGPEALKKAFDNAEEVPLEGVFTADDVMDDLRQLQEHGLQRGMTLGFKQLDNLLSINRGQLCVVTGVPNDGKSEWVDYIAMLLNVRYGLKTAFFTPENFPICLHEAKLMEKLIGKRLGGYSGMKVAEMEQAAEYLSDNFFDIMPEEDFTLQTVLNKAETLVRRHGIHVLVIDPYNALEHKMPYGMKEPEYISFFLDVLKNFAHRKNVLVILVAHPTKMKRDPITGKTPTPEMYDINGSAAYFNKCDVGLCIERDRKAGLSIVHVQKMRFRHMGHTGDATFMFQDLDGRFIPCEVPEQEGVQGPEPEWDHSNWLELCLKNRQKEQELFDHPDEKEKVTA